MNDLRKQAAALGSRATQIRLLLKSVAVSAEGSLDASEVSDALYGIAALSGSLSELAGKLEVALSHVRIEAAETEVRP
jgi:hypothetical protein